MKKLKVFFSQPMRGKSEQQIRENRKQFWSVFQPECAKDLGILEEELELIDSILSEPDVPTVRLLAKSIEMMQEADIVVFLPGWDESRGCKVEFDIATKYKVEMKLRRIYYF